MLDPEEVQKMIAKLVAEDAAHEATIQHLAAQRVSLQAAIASLSTVLAGPETVVEFDGKLAEACRVVLQKSGKPLTPIEVRDGVKSIGYDLTKHKNEMAAIHSVLKRLADTDSKEPKQVKRHDLKDGTKYSWIDPEPRPGTMGALTVRARPYTPIDSVNLGAAMQAAIKNADAEQLLFSKRLDEMFSAVNNSKLREQMEQAQKIMATMPDFKVPKF
jgi:hypothetical protein